MQNAQTLQKALNYHQAGRLDKAESLYRAMLKQNRKDGQLLHLLAIAADQQGRAKEALDLLESTLGPNCPPDNLKTYAQLLLKAGRWTEAEPIYKQAIAAFPADHILQAELGEVYRNMERFEEQIAQFRKAIALKPDYAEAHNNLAVGLNMIGDVDGAIESFKNASRLTDNEMTWNNLGLLTFKKGDSETALDYFYKAIAVKPDHAQAHNNIAVTLAKMNKTEDAFKECKKAIEADPDCVEAHINLVSGALLLQRPFDAMASCLKLIELKPDSAVGYTKLALSLCEQGQYPEAITAAYKAIALEPDDYEPYQAIIPALSKLSRYDEARAVAAKLLSLKDDAATFCTVGLALAEAGQFDEALVMCGKAIELEPTNHVFYHSIGCIMHAAGQYEASITMCTKVLEMKPDYPLARWDRSLMLLMTGDFKTGWAEFESRWDTAQLRYDEHRIEGPRWNGEDLHGKTVLITAEQGLGDTIQFLRYVPLLVERGARVNLFIQAPLKKLCSGMQGVSEVFCYGETPGPFDYQCPTMSLPMLFGTEQDTVPFKTSYLTVDPAEHQKWVARVARDKPGLKVGLVWAGNPKHRNNRHRSMKLAQFTSLFDLPNIHWYSLQVGAGEEQLADLPVGKIDNLRPDINDFTDTAAAISALDLVISVDTSTVHLAGALGKPIWVMVPHVPDWRWMKERRDNPWYESLLVFRQSDHGNWPSVIADLDATLRAVLAADGIGQNTPETAPVS